MTNTLKIYDSHDTAFNNIDAYVIAEIKGDYNHSIERLATIAFKRGKTGNVKCFFHVIGQQMQSGNAGGGGYDKLSAAFCDAAGKHLKNITHLHKAALTCQPTISTPSELMELLKEQDVATRLFKAATKGNGSSQWANELRNAGFYLLQAV